MLDISEIIKDLLELVKKDNPNYELILRDAFKRGFGEGMRIKQESLLELIGGEQYKLYKQSHVELQNLKIAVKNN